MTKVSIALCTYNGSEFLLEQLQSFASQTRLPDEIVVCDDRSQDRTAEIVQAFAATSNIPVHLHCNEENLGYIKNFSKALSLATGDIILLSDQDDVWLPAKVEKFVAAFEQRPDSLMVFSDANLVNESLQFLGQTFWQFHFFDQSAQALMQSANGFNFVLQRVNLLCGNAMAIRPALLKFGLPIPPGFPHDIWLGMLSVALGKVNLIDEPMSDYRQHTQQISGQRPVGLFNLPRRYYKALQCFRDVTLNQRWLFEHEALRDRLQQITEYPVSPDVLELLDAKIKYLQAQNQLRQRPFFLRPPILYRELASGRYARFSRGWKHLVVDLLL